MNFDNFRPQCHFEKRRESNTHVERKRVLTEILRIADFLKSLIVGLIAYFDVFTNIDEPGPHVELFVAHVLDLPQKLVLQATIDPSFDRDVLGNGLGEGAECAPAEEEEDGTGAVDYGCISVVDECVREVEYRNEDANQTAEELHRLVKHLGQCWAVFW